VQVFILLFIVFAGFAALAGHRKVPNPHNFDNAFRLEVGEGYGGGGAYAYATAILRIVYSYKGWENVNYVLGEVKSPVKTLKIAAPLAIGGTTILYVLANVAYFAAIPKEELAASEVIVAGEFHPFDDFETCQTDLLQSQVSSSAMSLATLPVLVLSQLSSP
jgi:amino acid transporter